MAEHLLTELAYSALPRKIVLQGTRDAVSTVAPRFKLKRCRWFYAVRMLPVRRRPERARPLLFLVAAMQLLHERDPLEAYEEGNPRAMILAPTRELAVRFITMR